MTYEEEIKKYPGKIHVTHVKCATCKERVTAAPAFTCMDPPKFRGFIFKCKCRFDETHYPTINEGIGGWIGKYGQAV